MAFKLIHIASLSSDNKNQKYYSSFAAAAFSVEARSIKNCKIESTPALLNEEDNSIYKLTSIDEDIYKDIANLALGAVHQLFKITTTHDNTSGSGMGGSIYRTVHISKNPARPNYDESAVPISVYLSAEGNSYLLENNKIVLSPIEKEFHAFLPQYNAVLQESKRTIKNETAELFTLFQATRAKLDKKAQSLAKIQEEISTIENQLTGMQP